MKKFGTFFVIGLVASLSYADIYTDATGDLNDGTSGEDLSGFTHLDIDQVEIVNDLTTITFTISVVADPITTPDWGTYMIGIDSVVGGDTSVGDNTAPANGNGWDRPIQMSNGMDYWIGSWVNTGGGAQVWSYDGANWNLDASPAPTIGSELTITANLSDLGLNVGNTFTFDVYTSGTGGIESAVDALSSATPSITTWGGPYDTGSSGRTYTVVPEPSVLALSGLGLLIVAVRFFGRK